MVYFLQFLNFLQARVRDLHNIDHSSYTATILLLGIPNVGKSALANSLHRIGRISAAGTTLNHFLFNFLFWDLDCVGGVFSSIMYSEYWVNSNTFLEIGSLIEKGRLKHATVSPQPGETKDISSLKVCSLCLLTSYVVGSLSPIC